MMQGSLRRIAWLDIAKAFTIFLVVFGHVMRGGAAHKIVYSFHVATFFFLAGMTCDTRDIRKKIIQDFRRLIVPYFLFGVLSILIFAILGRFAAESFDLIIDNSLLNNFLNLLYGSSKGSRLKFNTPLWFLPCLFSAKLCFYLLNKVLGNNLNRVLICSVTICLIGFWYTSFSFPQLPFSINIAVKLLPLFVLGRIVFLQYCQFSNRVISKSKLYVLGVILIFLASIVGFYSPAVNYSGDTFPCLITFFITACTGIGGITLISIAINRCKWLEYVGSHTLAILVMHKFPIVFFQTIGPFKVVLKKYDSFQGIVGGIAVSLIAIILCLIMERVILKFVPFLLGK